MKQAVQLLKMDERGRVRTSRERREMLLEEFERSGTSAASFAKLAGVCYSTFAGWVHRRRKEKGARMAGVQATTTVMPWVETTVAKEPSDATRALWVHLPGGARVEVADAGQVEMAAQLLRAMSLGGERRIC
jgi:transposase-like protein